MKFLRKIFCLHDWKSHTKKVYKWNETSVVRNTSHWYNPLTEIQEISSTTEVLICKHCGKIKIIEF